MLKNSTVIRKRQLRHFEENGYDCCVLCGKNTEIPHDVPIDSRMCYVENIGQLCLPCWEKLNSTDAGKNK